MAHHKHTFNQLPYHLATVHHSRSHGTASQPQKRFAKQ
jgi:hypothetical protein